MGKVVKPTQVAKCPFALYKKFLFSVCFQVKRGVCFYFSSTPFNYETLTALLYALLK